MANHVVRSGWLLLSLISSLGVTVSCSRDKHRSDGGPPVGGGSTPRSSAAGGSSASASSSSVATDSSVSDPAPSDSTGIDAANAETEVTAADSSWVSGELQDIGPAGPASAWSRGVVMVNKQSELIVLPLGPGGRFQELDADRHAFAKYGRGPALTERFAYWISLSGELSRAPLKDPSAVETLHPSARAGTRVAALTIGERDLVAFVAELDGEPLSLLWTGAGEPLRLSPEGSTASSVQLVALGRGSLALSLEGRTGMSPVHARLVRVAKRGVGLGEDRVVWVGPGSHPLTELELVSVSPDRASAFVAAARSITEFGLAHFAVGEALEPVMEADFRPYPNGIDPAPVSAARLCGGAYVFFAQPSTATPRAPQELRVVAVQSGASGPPAQAEIIARARAFNDISVAARPGGATLVWTADRRTWAMTLNCAPSSVAAPPRGD